MIVHLATGGGYRAYAESQSTEMEVMIRPSWGLSFKAEGSEPVGLFHGPFLTSSAAAISKFAPPLLWRIRYRQTCFRMRRGPANISASGCRGRFIFRWAGRGGQASQPVALAWSTLRACRLKGHPSCKSTTDRFPFVVLVEKSATLK